jgi:DNA-binding NarL/FixJ family response regulator
MSAFLAIAPRREEEHLDTESLEQLVIVCLEGLANLAQRHGQQRRAVRLQDAAGLLRREPGSGVACPLSPREWEVATLVVRGLSNRQIAHELVLSERTVDTHISHILSKLGLVSRAQIAAWVVQPSAVSRQLSVVES